MVDGQPVAHVTSFETSVDDPGFEGGSCTITGPMRVDERNKLRLMAWMGLEYAQTFQN